jgi:hypothetical protein
LKGWITQESAASVTSGLDCLVWQIRISLILWWQDVVHENYTIIIIAYGMKLPGALDNEEDALPQPYMSRIKRNSSKIIRLPNSTVCLTIFILWGYFSQK